MGDYVLTPARLAAREAAKARGGWTDERIAALRQLWQDGRSASEIARTLGGVSRNGVIGKVHRLGLPHRSKEAAVVNRQRAQPRQPNSTWTPMRLQVLRDLAAAGMNGAEIARALGGITRGAVVKKARTEGIEIIKPEPRQPKQVAEKARNNYGIAGNGAVFQKEPGGKSAIVPIDRLNERKRIADGASSNPLPLVELGRCQCRWPLGGLFEPVSLFCADPTEEGVPYCAEHQRASRRAGSAKSPKELARLFRRAA